MFNKIVLFCIQTVTIKAILVIKPTFTVHKNERGKKELPYRNRNYLKTIGYNKDSLKMYLYNICCKVRKLYMIYLYNRSINKVAFTLTQYNLMYHISCQFADGYLTKDHSNWLISTRDKGKVTLFQSLYEVVTSPMSLLIHVSDFTTTKLSLSSLHHEN